MKRALMGLGLAAAMAAGAVPAMGQDADETSPSAQPTEIPVTTASGRPDLYLDMPYYIGGFEPEVAMTRGQEHWAGLAADDPTRVELEAFIETVDAEIEDMVSGYALVSQEDFFAFVVGIRVDGAQPGSLLPAYLPILTADLEDPATTIDRIGGRDVTVISSVGEADEYVELFLYDQGDTIWIVQGPSDVSALTLENLPDPLTAD
jgi:hypothetical protein